MLTFVIALSADAPTVRLSKYLQTLPESHSICVFVGAMARGSVFHDRYRHSVLIHIAERTTLQTSLSTRRSQSAITVFRRLWHVGSSAVRW